VQPTCVYCITSWQRVNTVRPQQVVAGRHWKAVVVTGPALNAVVVSDEHARARHLRATPRSSCAAHKCTDILTLPKPSHAWHSCVSFRTCLRRTCLGSARPCHARGQTRAGKTHSINTRPAARLHMPDARSSFPQIVALGKYGIAWIELPTPEPHAETCPSHIYVDTKLRRNALSWHCHACHSTTTMMQSLEPTALTETELS
jgi:hypothetical protein